MTEAAAYAGIGQSTLYEWVNRGRAEATRLADDPKAKPDPKEAPFLELADMVEKARGEAWVRNLMLIQRAARDGTWQAAAWFMERSAPDRWGRRYQTVEHTGPEGGPVQTQVSVSVADLEAELSEIIQARQKNAE